MYVESTSVASGLRCEHWNYAVLFLFERIVLRRKDFRNAENQCVVR